jgi:hypothetical protein
LRNKISYSYILINTTLENEHEVYNTLLDYPSITELNPLFDEYNYNIIAKVKYFENIKKMKKFVENKIESLDGVVDAKILR